MNPHTRRPPEPRSRGSGSGNGRRRRLEAGKPRAGHGRPIVRRGQHAGRSRFMLVLSRHRDETIMIGDEIELTVVDIRGDKVRLGIKAPSRIAVHRKEVYDAIKRENEQAASFRDGELGAPRAHTPPGRPPRIPRTSATRLDDEAGGSRKESA